jgi:hypothetical protein
MTKLSIPQQPLPSRLFENPGFQTGGYDREAALKYGC